MGLDEFLDPPEHRQSQPEQKQRPQKQIHVKNTPKEQNVHDDTDEIDEKHLDAPEELDDRIVDLPLTPDVGADTQNVYLLDSVYDGTTQKARLSFYHDESKDLYYWIDTGSNLPYLLTTQPEDVVRAIIGSNKNFMGTELVKKISLLKWKEIRLTKVFGKTPTDIGGNANSFREYIFPAYEANIRYHFNFMADQQITPATFYNVKEGNLIHSGLELSNQVRTELEQEFMEESDEEKEMLQEYMPLLFQSVPEIRRAAYDIEVGSPQGRMPNTENPTHPIISIALVDTDGSKVFWALKRSDSNQPQSAQDIQIRLFDDEREMLLDFFDFIPQYPLLISFNGDAFDNPYLYNRASRLKIEKEDNPITIRRNETGFKSSLHFDLHVFFRNAAIRTYAFGAAYEYASLDDISQALLGEKKMEHPDVWINDMDLETLMRYNMQDTELTLKLTTYDNSLVMRLVFILMRITKVPFTDFTRTNVSTWLKYWLIYEHRKRNYLVPLKEEIAAVGGGSGESSAIIEGKKYQGAIVIDPAPGVWWNVQVFDFASLYPSIIKTRNLSYETINCPHEDCRTNRVPELSYWVCTKRTGIVALMIGFVRDIRVKYFKPRKRQNPSFSVIEQALKVLINAGYGVLGSAAFDFYCLPVAESTTAYARDAIIKTKNYVEKELGLKVLYGDTDSVFIHNPSDEAVKNLAAWSLANLKIELGKDYDFRFAIFTSRKKNYLGITKSGKPVVKGLVAKKKNTPNIIREYFDKMLNILSSVTNEEELANAKKQVTDLLKGLVNRVKTNQLSINDVIIRTTFTRKVKDYETWTQPIQALAQLLEQNYPGAEQIDVGDTIEYVPIQTPIKVKIASRRLSFPYGEYKEASVKPVQLVTDEDLLGKNLIDLAQTAFEQIIEPLGITWKKDIMGQKSIDDFF